MARVQKQRQKKEFDTPLSAFLFSQSPDTFQNRRSWALLLLFLFGILHWVAFLYTSRSFYDTGDWWLEYNYLSVLKQAVAHGIVPYHYSSLIHNTTRFLAIPEGLSIFMPLICILPIVGTKAYVLIHILFLYAAGYTGSLVLKHRYSISIASFAMFFLLFNFNGHITAHLSAGNFTWSGYFLVPWLLVYLLEMCGPDGTYETSVKLAFVFFLIELMGSFHIVTMFMLFICVVMVCDWKNAFKYGAAILLTVLFCIFRLLPAQLSLHEESAPLPGVPSLFQLITDFVVVQRPAYFPLGGLTTGTWEFDHYIGIIGLVFIGYFGIYCQIRNGSRSNVPNLLPFLIASMVMVVLSIGQSWNITRGVLPFKIGEKVPSRFLIVPLIMLATMASLHASNPKFTPLRGRTHIIGALICVPLAALSLMWHSAVWVPRAWDQWAPVIDASRTKGDYILNIKDPGYRLVIGASLGVSASAIAIAIACPFPRKEQFSFTFSRLLRRSLAVSISAGIFLGAFFFVSSRRSDVWDGNLRQFGSSKAYVLYTLLPFIGPDLKVIFTSPVALRSISLFGSSELGHGIQQGALEIEGGVANMTGPLPPDGSPIILKTDTPQTVRWFTFFTLKAERPGNFPAQVSVDCSPIEDANLLN